MSGYGSFAQFYDELTANVGYPALERKYLSLIDRFGGKRGGILLDLACGTGSLSELFASSGFDVIGTDASPQMLNRAFEKKQESGLPIQYLCQDMRSLDMFGTIDITVCALDSLNHLHSSADVGRVFSRVSLFSEPGGLFLFDVNTVYKHKAVLANNIFIYETENTYCVWENEYCAEKQCTAISLNIFSGKDGVYRRFREDFSEYAFSASVLEKLLAENDFEMLGAFDYDTLELPEENSEKIIFAARKNSQAK